MAGGGANARRQAGAHADAAASVNFTDAGYTTLTPPGAQAYFALAFTEGGRDALLGRLTDVPSTARLACRGSDGRACEAAGVS